MKKDIDRIYTIDADLYEEESIDRDRTGKEAIPARDRKSRNRKIEKVLIMLGLALMEATGIFMLVCGIFSFDIATIGGLASLGYVIGIGGMIFAFMLLFQKDDRKTALREKHS